MTITSQKLLYPLILSFIVIITGCAGALPKSLGTIERGPVSGTFNIEFPKLDPVTGKQVEFDASRYNFSSEIQSLSKYPSSRTYGGDTVRLYKGVSVNKKSNIYEITYSKGDYFPSTESLYATKVVFYADSKVDGNKVTLTLKPNFSIQPMKNPLGIEQETLDSIANLKSDAVNIISKLNTIVVTQQKKHIISGDINVAFPPESVYANFERLLGKYEWGRSESIKEFKKENTYKLSMNNRDFPVNVEIYPYRNGSKVIYTAQIDYELSSNGSSTLSLNDLETLKEIIESTASN